MVMTQLNVRIDTLVKDEVEQVLKQQGISTSDVIRSLWSYIADHHEIPQLETSQEHRIREERKMHKLSLIEHSSGYIQQELVKAGVVNNDVDLVEDEQYEQLHDDMYDQRLDDYLNMKRV